ncbi:MAG: hypothetical protein LQ340_002752 [Diploschistes diacapsis]|nr:MAG: hypothetical protein LQ340_002752 [Diploschistes diacapsis]
MLDNLASPTPTNGTAIGEEKRGFRWERPRLHRNKNSGHKVSLSGSSKGSHKENGYSSQSDNSRPSSPRPPPGDGMRSAMPWNPPPDITLHPPPTKDVPWQLINRQADSIWRYDRSNFVRCRYLTSSSDAFPSPALLEPETRPFLVYSDTFLQALGNSPTLQLLIEDRRAPYFYCSGIFHPKSNTLFVSSAPIPDSSPSAAPSRNLLVVLSKFEFFSTPDFARDKVRTPEHSYMLQSGCVFDQGIVMCAAGTFKEPAALVYMDTKRPHKTYPLLTNFYGTPLNSPHSCVSHPDGSIWFSDPHLSHSPSYRPKPQLPPLIYRFDPQTSDLRAMTNEIAWPTALAFSLNHKTLYVVDAPPKSADSIARSTIYAFSVVQPLTFLTQKRLFALPSSAPHALAVDVLNNVYAACRDGVHVFNEGGSLVGRILIEGGATGLCFGRSGELWACGGEKIWRVKMDPGTKGATLRL